MPDWWLIYALIACFLFIPAVIVLYVVIDKLEGAFRNLTGWR